MDDKQAFDTAAAEFDRIKAFLDKPRCINCDEFSMGACRHYGQVPDHHWYKPTECVKWFMKIPF